MIEQNKNPNNPDSPEVTESGCCKEFATRNRRRFLRRSLPAAAAAITSPAWLPKVTLGRDFVSNRDVFIQVFLRGGMDGLTTCVPYGDPNLYTARPRLAIPPPGAPQGAIDLDGFFGLPQAASSFLPAYQAGHLAFIHATGSTDPSHSHFDAEQIMEYGIPEQPIESASDGWLARHLLNTTPMAGGVLRGVAASGIVPHTFDGAPNVISIKDFSNVRLFPGDEETLELRRSALQSMYSYTEQPTRSAGLNTLETIDLLAAIDFDNYAPDNGAAYTDSFFGINFRGLAALIKAEVGVETALLELGGWDLHANLGPHTGPMATLLTNLSSNLHAFYLDMQSHIDNVVVVVMSEFGRRVKENRSNGVDHGHGNCMIAMGGGIRGGQVLTQWPGLDPSQLDRGDLANTTDYRDIMAEILDRRMQTERMDLVFPSYTPSYKGITV